ncbi:MAG: hypothetical protein OHK0022_28600 [Roseiflexaceae bacterium]
MRFIHVLTGEPVEERYAEWLDPNYEYYRPEHVGDAQMMVDLIRYLEAREIGANTTVGTRLDYLTFREIAEFSGREVWIAAWNGQYHVLYHWLGEEAGPWYGAEITGVTPDLATAAELVQAAFRRAFAPYTEQQLHAMRRGWALTDHRTPEPRPPRPAGPRLPLRRISQQPEPVEDVYRRIADTGDRRLAPKAQAMLELLPLLERNRRYRRFWAYTDQTNLVFTDTDGPHAGVTLAANRTLFIDTLTTNTTSYRFSYALPADSAPWPDARISTYTEDTEKADELLEAALGRLFG